MENHHIKHEYNYSVQSSKRSTQKIQDLVMKSRSDELSEEEKITSKILLRHAISDLRTPLDWLTFEIAKEHDPAIVNHKERFALGWPSFFAKSRWDDYRKKYKVWLPEEFFEFAEVLQPYHYIDKEFDRYPVQHDLFRLIVFDNYKKHVSLAKVEPKSGINNMTICGPNSVRESSIEVRYLQYEVSTLINSETKNLSIKNTDMDSIIMSVNKILERLQQRKFQPFPIYYLK